MQSSERVAAANGKTIHKKSQIVGRLAQTPYKPAPSQLKTFGRKRISDY
jgi:hypothetical protein